MCGIFGVALLPGKNIKDTILRNIIRKLALASQVRGGDATGLAFTSNEGISVFKKNVRASKFVTLDNYISAVHDGLSQSGKRKVFSVIGHTRYETCGTHINNDNNHPIIARSIVGVHNGMITNHMSIFSKLEAAENDTITRIGQVDSEAIFALVDHKSKCHKYPGKMQSTNLIGNIANPTTLGILEASEQLAGSYACALVDADNPKILWLFRRGNPIKVKHYRDEGILIFASDARYINSAVEQYNLAAPDEYIIQDGDGLCINLSESKFSCFSLRALAAASTRSFKCYH